jgi:PAS domain S-box-containing protein
MAASGNPASRLYTHPLRSPWPWVGLVIAVLFTLSAWQLIHRVEESRLVSLQAAQATSIVQRVEWRMKALEQMLRSSAAYLGRGPLPTRAEWRSFVGELNFTATYPGIQGVGFVEWIPREGMAAHVQRIRKEGFPDYSVAPGGPLMPMPEGFSSIVYLEPMDDRNRQAFGKDMLTEPTRREALLEARDTGLVVLTGKVALYHEIHAEVQTGTILLAPVYTQGQPLDTVAQRRKAFRGWASCPLRMTEFMGAALSQERGLADVEFYDGPVPSPETRLFDSEPSQAPSRAGPRLVRHLEVAGRVWTAMVEPSEAFYAEMGRKSHWEVLSGGLTASLLLFVVLVVIVGAEGRARQLADQRGKEILATEAQFRALFECATLGMAIVDTRSGRYLSVNPRLGMILGYSTEELLERTFSDVTHPDYLKADLDAARDMAAGKIWEIQHEKCYVHRDGHVIWGRLDLVRLPTLPGEPPRHLALLEDISELRRVAEIIRANEERFRLLFELSPDPTTLSRLSDGVLVMVNQAWCDITGLKEEEALGHSPTVLGVWAHPEARQSLVEELRRYGAITTRESTLLRRDGSERHVLITARLMHLGDEELALVMGKDVTERHEAEEALKASESRFRSVIENAGDAIFLNDEEGHILLCNRAASTSTGYSMDELLRMRVGDLDPGYAEADNARARQTLKVGQQASISARHRRKDGTTFPVEVRISLLREEEPRQILAVVRDLSEREQVQENEHRARKAESLVLMAGGIAHDFNNLFQAIQGNLEIIWMRAKGVPPIAEPLSRAQGALNRAVSLSWKMLDFSGHGFVQLESLDLENWLPAYLATLQMELPSAFRLDLTCDPVPRIMADRSKLEQMVKAIVDNAQEAADPGSGHVRLRLHVDFGEDQPRPSETGIWPLKRPGLPATVCVEITDDGPGVPPEKLHLICDPFTTTKEPGRGLGLPVVVGLLRAHRAGLHLLNGEGKGLILRIHFPPA